MRIQAAVLLLCVTALAGCSDDSVGGVATAKDLLARAESEARRWDAGAELAGVGSVESPHADEMRQMARDSFEEEDFEEGQAEDSEWALRMMPRNDNEPGDGRAPAWMFTFHSGSSVLLVVVDAGGRADSREAGSDGMDEMMEAEGAIDTSQWAIDSDEASRIAAEHNATYSRARGDPDYTAFTFLSPGADWFGDANSTEPYWFLGIEREDGGEEEGAFVIVNARNGTVVDFEGMYADLFEDLFQPPESGQEEGRVTALQPVGDGHVVPILSDAHSRLAVVLDAEVSLPIDAATLTVLDPTGQPHEVQMEGSAAGTVPGILILEDPPAGDYQATVRLDTGAILDYTISWCTDGFDLGFDFAVNPACEAVYEEA